MSLARQSLTAAVAAVVTAASRMLIVAILARRLPPAAFGQFVYAQWLVDFAILLCSFGAPAAVSRYAAEFGRDAARVAGFLRPWQWWAACSSLAGALAAVAGGWVSGMQLSAAGYVSLFLWATTQNVWAAYTAALTGCQRFGAIALMNVVYAATIALAVWLLPPTLAPGPTLFGMLSIAAATAATAGIVIVTRQAIATATALDEEQWRSIRTYAGNMWMTALMTSLVWSRGEYPLVRVLLGDEALARYAAPMTLFAAGVQVVMLVVAGATPYLTELWGQGRHDSMVLLARRLMNLQLLFCGVVALTLTFLSNELLRLAFGDTYRDPESILPILSLGLLLLAFSAPNHLLQIATDGGFSRKVSVFGIVVLFTLATVLTPILGLKGAALARALTMTGVALVTGMTAVTRWGSRVMPVRNTAATALAVVTAIVLVVHDRDLGFVERVGGLAAVVFMLGIAMRGDVVAVTTLRRLRAHWTPAVETMTG